VHQIDVQNVGENDARLWGLTAKQRLARIVEAKAGSIKVDGSGPILANDHYVFDWQWLKLIAEKSASVLTVDGIPVLANCTGREQETALREAMESQQTVSVSGLTQIETTSGIQLENRELRKRETPFIGRLTMDTARILERQSYYGAYKGVTDVLTKYLWPELALVLTRWAARLGISPNMVTAVGAILCVWATILFAHGQYFFGMLAGFVFMVLDTVDGKLARCTITSSKWGDVFDHGIDLVHPPFWWYAWAIGLTVYGRPLGAFTENWVLAVILVGYVVQRLVEGAFMRRFGMHIHVWEKIDSDFRLITARRNPNMVILFFATLAGRPDLGLILVAVWTLLSLLFHAVRYVQAEVRTGTGGAINSWLESR